MQLKILSWNAQSIRNKSDLFNHLQSQTFPYHLVLIQETWLNPKVDFKYPSHYTCLRKDRTNNKKKNSQCPHGGVLILILKSLEFKIVSTAPLLHVEAIFVQLTIDSVTVNIGSVYSSSSLTRAEAKSDLEKLLSFRGPFVIAGDLNAKHKDWNNIKNSHKGIDLEALCSQHDCDVLFPDEPSLYHASTGQSSTVDLVIIKGIAGVSKPITINDPSSDHLPIVFKLPLNFNFPIDAKIKNFKNADWKKFRTTVEQLIILNPENVPLTSSEQIETQVEYLTTSLLHAAKVSIPLKKPSKFKYPDSQEIRDLKLEKNRLRAAMRILPSLKNQVNRVNKLIKTASAQLKVRTFNDKLALLDKKDLSLFSFARALKKKFNPIPPLKNPNNESVYSAKEKSDLVASSFLKAHQISQSPSCHTINVDQSIAFVDQTGTGFQPHDKVSIGQIKSEINFLKNNKAAGYDDISNRIIKNIPDCAIVLLSKIYSACLKIGHFPKQWKRGKIVAIGKPGKNVELPSSYRPITLLPVLGKIFEKIILNRFRDCELDKETIIPQQFGFRSNHSTTQQVLRLTEFISLRFNQNKSTAITLLDVEKAFDSVWHDALIHKLHKNGFPVILLKITQSFLRDRISFVCIDGIKSFEYAIPAGVPQGSPLSPHLYNIFVNDVPIPKHCKLAVYADDTALASSIINYNLPTLVERMEIGLTELQKFFDSWKIKINATKTESILFTKSPKMAKLKKIYKIAFNGVELEWLDVARYLGVYLDSKLTFRQNTEAFIKKANKAISLLYPMLVRNNRILPKTKIFMYKTYIRPILTYACAVFNNCAKTHLNKLQIIQNKSLRHALNSHFHTRITDLHSESNVPTIREYIDKLTSNFYKKSSNSKNKLIRKLGAYSHDATLIRVKHRLPLII